MSVSVLKSACLNLVVRRIHKLESHSHQNRKIQTKLKYFQWVVFLGRIYRYEWYIIMISMPGQIILLSAGHVSIWIYEQLRGAIKPSPEL